MNFDDRRTMLSKYVNSMHMGFSSSSSFSGILGAETSSDMITNAVNERIPVHERVPLVRNVYAIENRVESQQEILIHPNRLVGILSHEMSSANLSARKM